jgi:superfamily II DNA or RNA helicase
MKIFIDDKFVVLKDLTKEEKASLKGRFTFEDKSKVFSGGTFDSRKIKKVSFIKFSKEFVFLFSGFLKELLVFIKENKYKVEELEDNRTKIDFSYLNENTRKFFPEHFIYTEHQEEALKNMFKTNVGILSLKTSSGKTDIFIAYLKATKMRALILMDKVSLVEQTAKRLKKAGFKNVGMVHGKSLEDGDIVVATIQSVKKIPSFVKFKCLIIDEIHHSSNNTFQEFLYNTSFPFRFGFSATPNSGDKFKWAKIRQYMGDIIYETDAERLIEKKVIARPVIKFLENKGRPTLDWPSAYQLCIAENSERNNKIKSLIEEYNTQTLILIKHLVHGEILEELIENSIFLSGRNSIEEREETIEKFENNEINTIIATSIFNEGISINSIKLLIIASGGKSKIETIQKLGRSLRTNPEINKFEVLVYDFLDRGNRFTLRHSKERAKIYKKEGFDIKLPEK